MPRRLLVSEDDTRKIVRPITQVTPYYNNPYMLKLHIKNWLEYPLDMMQQFKVIIVDDGSKSYTAHSVLKGAPEFLRSRMRLFRVTKDIPWNQHGARNLGAKMADTEWLWMADMDRVMLYPWMRKAMSVKLEQRPYVARGLDRGNDLAKVDKPKMTNQFFVPKKVYWDAGGYDEFYCGTYGCDGEFFMAMEEVSDLMTYLPGVYHFRYGTGVVEDCTTDMDRNEIYKPLHREKVLEKRVAGKKLMVEPINFPWEEIKL